MEHVAEDLAVTSETARQRPADEVDLTKVQKPVGAGAPKYTNPRRTRAVVTLSVLVVTLVAVTIVSAGACLVRPQMGFHPATAGVGDR